jgi:hypothetical protein
MLTALIDRSWPGTLLAEASERYARYGHELKLAGFTWWRG